MGHHGERLIVVSRPPDNTKRKSIINGNWK